MKNNQNDFEQFAENLCQESPRGWAELESMRYGLMARLGLDEADALELAAKIVASPKQIKKENTTMTLNLQELIATLDDIEFEHLLAGLTGSEQVELYKSLRTGVQPRNEPPTNIEQIERNAARLQKLYKNKSANREAIAQIEMEQSVLWPSVDAQVARDKAEAREVVDIQVAQLESKRNILLEEWGRYSKTPSKFRARMQELTSQMNEIEQQILQVKA